MRTMILEGTSAYELQMNLNEQLKKLDKKEFVQDIKFAILARDQYTSRYCAMLILSEIPTQ